MKKHYSPIWFMFELSRWIAERKASVKRELREFEYYPGEGLHDRLALIVRRQWLREAMARNLEIFNQREAIA